jgi:signal transduction histidine kinase
MQGWIERRDPTTCDIAEDVPACVGLDPLRLRQILVNLLQNAIKFTALGAVGVSVTRTEMHGANRFCASRSKTLVSGCLRLFEPFSQADASTTKFFGGTGLGLTISRRLARMPGGDIIVESEAGRGSLFELRLPLLPVEPNAPSTKDFNRTLLGSM